MNRMKNLIEAAKPFDALYQPDGPISHWDREPDDRAIFGINAKTVFLGDFRRLRRALAEADAPAELPAGALATMDKAVRVLYRRNEALTGKRLDEVRAAVEELAATLAFVRDNAIYDTPDMWKRVDEALAPFEVAP